MSYHGKFLREMERARVKGVQDPKPTFWERALSWLVDTPIHASERELLMQQARRLQLATDIQEERLAARKARDKPVLVAVWKVKNIKIGGVEAIAIVHLEETRISKRRTWGIAGVHNAVDNSRMEHSADTLKQFLRSWGMFTGIVRPWLDGTIDYIEIDKPKDHPELQVIITRPKTKKEKPDG